MIMGWKKTLVYRSKDKGDWDKAKKLLEEADIVYFPFAAQESPIPGCGAKVDPRRFLNKNPVPSTIYRIEVLMENRERAGSILEGKVLPIRSYGYSI
jgi:hypothetical protein